MYRISLLWCPWARQFGHIRLGTLWQLPCLGTLSKGWPPLRFILVFKAYWLRDKILSAYWRTRAAQGLLYRLPVNLMHLIVLLTFCSRVLEYYTNTGKNRFSYVRFMATFFENALFCEISLQGEGIQQARRLYLHIAVQNGHGFFLYRYSVKGTWNTILECPITPRYCAVAMMAFNTIMYEKKSLQIVTCCFLITITAYRTILLRFT